MENEKLKLLLNKVVEYNNPKANSGKGRHFKAFLYKNKRGEFYFKVVETLIDFSINFDDIIYLNEGDENYLIIAAKPKLMRVSKNSWHYGLIKYVLRDSAPTPRDMQNGCPYFWLLIFSVLVLPFVLMFKVVKWVVLLVPKFIFFILEELVNAWIAGLDDEAAYDLQQNIGYSSGRAKLPTTAKLFFNNNGDVDFFEMFLEQKYSGLSKTDPEYAEKRQEIKNKWVTWNDEQRTKRNEQREIEWKREDDIRKRRAENTRLRKEAEERWEARMKPIRDGFAEFGTWWTKTFTVKRGRVNTIVKRTKQFMGAIVTLIVVAATYFVVNYISLVLMVLIDAAIAGWMYLLILLGIAVACAIIYFLYVLVSSWGQSVVNEYNRGKKVWYVEPVIYLVWYPVKYFVLALSFIVVHIIWTPIRFLGYIMIFKYFLRPIGIFIGNAIVGLAKGIGSSTGIFGEYFGASYSDYCPGIEWTGFDEE